jgi:pimeloyl-ACP methyl ester carboxylesterase
MQLLKCCFGCLTCWGSCYSIPRKLIFQAPNPPSYSIREEDGEHKLVLKNRAGTELEREVLYLLQEKVEFVETAKGNRLPVYVLKHPDAIFTVILSHGNSSDLGHMVFRAMDLAIFCGVSVVLYEYSGYGLSTGKASEAAIYDDISAVFGYVTGTLQIPWHKVILYGQSLGSAPTIDLAAVQPVGGVILHSPLASVILVVASTETSSPSYDMFRSITKIGTLRCPVFYMHGTNDAIVPMRHSQWMYAHTNYQYPPWWVVGGDHNRLELNFREEFYSRLRNFVSHVEDLQAQLDIELLSTRFSPRVGKEGPASVSPC